MTKTKSLSKNKRDSSSKKKSAIDNGSNKKSKSWSSKKRGSSNKGRSVKDNGSKSKS